MEGLTRLHRRVASFQDFGTSHATDGGLPRVLGGQRSEVKEEVGAGPPAGGHERNWLPSSLGSRCA